MVKTDKITFGGGMNSDVDNSFLPSNQYKYSLNFRNGESGAIGVLTSTKGNELVTYTMPVGGNKVIGTVEYETESKVYYLVWNSNDNHVILEYDYSVNEIDLVFQSDLLGFASDVIVTGLFVVKFKSNKILYWTDNNGEPKKVSIESGVRTFDPIKGIFLGTWGVVTSADEGEVVKVDFGSNYYDRDFYYISSVDGNVSAPNEEINSPLPSSDWKLTSSGYVYPDVLELSSITQLPKPPTTPQIVTYEDDKTFRSNYLRGYFWQLRYKHVYADGQESAWSPYSKTPIPNFDSVPLYESFSGVVNSWNDNKIKSFIPVPNNPLISSIKLGARRVSDSRTPSDLFEYNEIFLDDASIVWTNEGILSYFDGSEDRIPSDITDSNQLFYYVPRKSKALTSTGDNRAVHANGLYGYNIDKNLLTEDRPSVDVFYSDDSNTSTPLTIVSGTPEDSFTIAIDPTSIGYGDKIIISFDWSITLTNGGVPTLSPSYSDSNSESITYRVRTTDVDDFEGDLAGLKAKIADDIAQIILFGYVTVVDGVSVNRHLITATSALEVITVSTENVAVNANTLTTESSNISANLVTPAYETASRSYKRGSTQTFGLAYSDELGRVSTVVSNEDLSKYVEWYNNNPLLVGNTYVTMMLNINHLAPEWATKCHIVKQYNNGVRDFVQLTLSINNLNSTTLNKTKFHVNGVISSDGTTKEADSAGTKALNMYLNALNGEGNRAYNNAVDTSVLSYSFTKGDRLRIISSAGGSVFYDEDENNIEILSYNDTYNYITVNYNEMNAVTAAILSTAQEENDNSILFEIYTPVSDTDLRGYYYETGITLNVENGIHTGTNDVPQVYGVSPAKVSLDCGDVYLKPRFYTTDGDATVNVTNFFLVEDYNFNDTYISKAYNVGRFNLKTQVDSSESSDDRSGQAQEVLKANTMFYSEPYIQGTDVNRLGTIYDTSFKETDASFNSIQKLHSDGDRIKIFLEDRVGFAYNSRYVATSLGNQNTISSGASSPAISDIQYYQYRGGISLNPESHKYFEGKDYFFDLRRGNICRLTNNGVDPISVKGVDSFTKNISDLMLSGAEKDIAIGAIDKRNQEYLLNFKWSETTSLSIPIGGSGIYSMVFDDDVYMSQFVVGDSYTFVGTNQFNYVGTLLSRAGQVGQFDFGVDEVTVVTTIDVYKSTVISFSDKLNVWNCFYDYIPDFLEGSGMDLVSWKDGQLYIHNSDSVVPLNFYGIQHDAGIEIASSASDPINVKSPTTLEIQDNSTYQLVGDVEVIDWETYDEGVKTETGQVSSLITEDFEYREGKAYAAFLRDENSPNLTYPLLDGDKLKGTWTSVKLRLNGGFTGVRKVASISVRQFLSFFAQ